MLESIIEYFNTCTYLTNLNSMVGANYLSQETYSISFNENAGYNPVISESIVGDMEMQFQFSIDCRFHWNEELKNNLDNSKFFENIRNWLIQKNINGEYPTLKKGATPISIEAESNGYIFDAEENYAIYRISCVLKYNAIDGISGGTDEPVSA